MRKFIFSVFTPLVLFVIIFDFAISAQAVPYFQANANCTINASGGAGAGYGTTTDSGSGPVSAGIYRADYSPASPLIANAEAHSGFLHADSYMKKNSSTADTSAQSSATFSFNDLIFSSAGSGTVSVGLDLNLVGQISSPDWSIVKVDVSLGSYTTSGTYQYWSTSDSATGLLSGLSGIGQSPVNTTLQVNATGIQLNTSLSLNITLWTEAAAVYNGNGSSNNVSFDLSYANINSIFDLPTDVVVNSTDGEIENNVFVGESTSVPEPTTVTLLGIGLAGLAGGAVMRKIRKKATRIPDYY